jgi:hypothetical protein
MAIPHLKHYLPFPGPLPIFDDVYTIPMRWSELMIFLFCDYHTYLDLGVAAVGRLDQSTSVRASLVNGEPFILIGQIHRWKVRPDFDFSPVPGSLLGDSLSLDPAEAPPPEWTSPSGRYVGSMGPWVRIIDFSDPLPDSA